MAHEPELDDQQLVDYLLGRLSEEDTERLDEMSIVDEEVAARLVAAENDLVDAYARGTLTGETLDRFMSSYLASPQRRQKVRFAEGFVRVIDRADSAPASKTSSASSAGRFSRLTWGLAAAAALLLIVTGGLLLNDTRLRSGLDEARRQAETLERRAQELEQQIGSEKTANAEARQELERVRVSLAELSQRLTTPGAPPAPTLTTVALVLLPQTRSAAPVTTMAVPAGAETIAFDLQLEGNDFARYEVVLKDPATNATLWRSNRTAARSTGGQSTVSIVVPATTLKSQHYSLELSGFGPTGDAQLMGNYTFRIVRR